MDMLDQNVESAETPLLDWDKVREKLESKQGKDYWRSLDELAETDDFKVWLDDEFPHRRDLPNVDRRTFLKFMGAGMALAGLVGCRSLPKSKLVPFVTDPEGRVPGVAQYYATTMPFAGFGFPVVVTSHEGRPTKLDGNSQHPWSQGRSDVFVQAEILSFYDPDRAQVVQESGTPATWKEFFTAFGKRLEAKGGKGEGVAILTGTVSSPTQIRLMNKLKAKYPSMRWYAFDTVSNENEGEGLKQVFGKSVRPVYDFSKAKTILSLDGDFLSGTPHTVKYAIDFAKTREIGDSMSRLYVAESSPTITGASADHRVVCKPSQIEGIASAVAAKLGISVATVANVVSEKWIAAVVSELNNGGVVYVGAHQTPFVHAVAALINQKFAGEACKYVAQENVIVGKTASLKNLADALNNGSVETLLVIGENPVYGAPGDINFKEAFVKAKFTACLGVTDNETSALANWSLPEAHFLESWGDQISPDGHLSIQQPLIEPLFEGKSAIEVLALIGGVAKTGEELVKETWPTQAKSKVAWEKGLNDGFFAQAPTYATGSGTAISPSAKTSEFEVVFLPDPSVYDGTRANNGWLQELPKPLTKLTWDNAVHISPETAKRLGLQDEYKVKVTVGNRSVVGAIFVQPGHPDNVATLHLGYGRTKGGRILVDTGFDFCPLRDSQQMGFGGGSIERVDGIYAMAAAQTHHSMEGRDIIREGTLAFWKEHENLTEAHQHELHLFYNLTEEIAVANPELPQWGMAIDLNTCTGCNACVAACQAENNIPTVGKYEVQRGRELHWLRIDRYYRVSESGENRDLITGAAEPGEGKIQSTLSGPLRDATAMDPNRVSTVFQPVACMHCETAPCEPVCPVAATVHSHEGLNQMVYNRCVGTRYCSNNCPYKVRRFNYYNYQHGQEDQLFPVKDKDGNWKVGKPYGQRNFQGEADKPMLRLLHNPNVTVRSRGVMEKCTYCVQRINAARITAKKEGRDIRDGEVVVACQQACPSKAISFGNISDPNSEVSKMKKDKRTYGLLADIGTKPRTTYMGRVRNPHPDLEVNS